MALSHDLCYSIVDLRLLLEYHDSSALRYLSFVMSLVTCLVGLVGNAVVIFLLGFIMKKHKSRYWFLNLAIADFLALLTLPFHAISTLKGTWTLGPHICKLFIFSSCVRMYSSVYILVALNIVKVLSVAQPMFHLKFISQRVTVLICILIWFIITLLSFPTFYSSGELKIGEVTICSLLGSNAVDTVVVNNKYNVSNGNATRNILFFDIFTTLSPYIQQCSSDICCGGEETLRFWNNMIYNSKWILIPFFIIGYFIPLGVVLICNITIVVHVRKSKTINPHRLYRTVLIIIVIYFITWIPQVMTKIVLSIAVRNMNLITMFKVFICMPLMLNIAYAQSCLNPILYVFTGKRMRTELSVFINSIRNKYK
ncbi:chemerin-like receptor 1 [Hyla sarda]|uniref:chemerin-like receptor 1 n=1 Tax=Hyla sarda TaxID=327740 RepID=UPI0024C41200|nr:chemerin-like receptor 1 [Hyla sarda]